MLPARVCFHASILAKNEDILGKFPSLPRISF